MEMRSGRFFRFTAPVVILATGGAGQVFPFTTNGAIKTGDGMAMAYRAGEPLKDMEFVQISSAARGVEPVLTVMTNISSTMFSNDMNP